MSEEFEGVTAIALAELIVGLVLFMSSNPYSIILFFMGGLTLLMRYLHSLQEESFH